MSRDTVIVTRVGRVSSVQSYNLIVKYPIVIIVENVSMAYVTARPDSRDSTASTRTAWTARAREGESASRESAFANQGSVV